MVKCKNQRIGNESHSVSKNWCNISQYNSWCGSCKHNKKRETSIYQDKNGKHRESSVEMA